MQNIGRVIKALREQSGLSAQGVSEGICSSKYIYMIERGDRFPSIDILTKLMRRLKFDLYNVIPFMDYENPLELFKEMNLVELKRRTGKFEEMYSIIAKLLVKYKDNNELIQTLILSQSVGAYRSNEYIESRELVIKALKLTGLTEEFNIQNIDRYSKNEISLYIVLTMCYIDDEKYVKAGIILESLFAYLKDLVGFTYYGENIIYTYLALAFLYNKKSHYKKALYLLEECNERLMREGSCFRLQRVYYFIALNYYCIKDFEKAKKNLLVSQKLASDKDDIETLKEIKELSMKLDITIQSEKATNMNDIIISVEIKNDNNDIMYVVKLIEPNILFVSVKSNYVGYLDELYGNINILLKKYFINKPSIHSIIDLREQLNNNFFYSPEEMKKLLELRQKSYEIVQRKSSIRIIDHRGASLSMYDMLIKSYTQDTSEILYQMDVPNMEVALKIIKLIDKN